MSTHDGRTGDIDVLDKFPVLHPSIEIHVNPQGGMLLLGGRLLSLTTQETLFLRACDGTHRLRDTVPDAWVEECGDLKFLAFVSHALNSGYLSLADQPSHCPPPLTGSTTAYIPLHLSVELTAACNLRCHHCYRESDFTQLGYMPTNTLLTTLDRLAAAGVRAVELTGGEPLLHHNFVDILEFCGERFRLTGVLTNGTILSEDIVRKLTSLGDRVLVGVSLDGPTAAVHNMRRGTSDAFQRSAANIARLAESGVVVRVAMCVDSENFADIENTLLLARSLGAAGFAYSAVLPFGRGRTCAGQHGSLDGKHAFEVEKSLRDKYAGFLSVLTSEELSALEKGNCGAGWRTYVMDPHGAVRPCPMFGPTDLTIGNLLEESIEEVFGHPVTAALAEMPSPNADICDACSRRHFCAHCGLRGFIGSQEGDECEWSRLPAVQKVRRFMSDVSV